MARKNYIQHIRSTEVVTEKEYGLDKVVAKLPEYDDILDGEIAINQHEGVETIVLRNDNENIVKFLNENVVYENEEITAAAIAQLQSELGNELQELRDNMPTEVIEAIVQNDLPQTLNESAPTPEQINDAPASVFDVIVSKDITYDLINTWVNENKDVILKATWQGSASLTPSQDVIIFRLVKKEKNYITANNNVIAFFANTHKHFDNGTDPQHDLVMFYIIYVNSNNEWWLEKTSFDKSYFYTKSEVDQLIAEGGNFDPNLYYDKTASDDRYYTKEQSNDRFLTEETDLSLGTTVGSGNVITDIRVNGHEITLTKDNFLDQNEIQALIDQVIAGEVDLTNYYTKSEIDTSLGDKTDYVVYNNATALEADTTQRLGTIGVVDDNSGHSTKSVYIFLPISGRNHWVEITNYIKSLPTYQEGQEVTVSNGDTYDTAFGKLLHIITDNEKVVSEALTDLQDNKVGTNELASVAFSGDYDDLTNKPSLSNDTTVRQNIKNDNSGYKVMLATVSNSGDIDEAGYTTEITHNPNGAVRTTTFNTTVVENGVSQSVPLTIGNGGVYFGSLTTAGNDYINGENYTGHALASETQIMSNLAANEEAYADGASLIGYYDDELGQEITVRQALEGVIQAIDDVEVISAGTGLTKSGSTLNHTNSVTANQNAVVKAFTFDSEGHIKSSVDAAKYTIENIGTDIRFNDVFLRRCQKDYSTGSESGTNGNALTTQYVPVVTEATSHPNNDEQQTPTTDPINNTDPVDAGGNSGGEVEMGEPRV